MTQKRPSIKQLEYFVAVARASNFRKAARNLGLSQPTLTLQIAEMEELMGVQLFDRSRAGTLLTPAGRNLLPLAREILDQFQLLTDLSEIGRDAELSGSFRLGVLPVLAPTLLPEVFPQLHERYPGLSLRVRVAWPGELEDGLERGDFDLILTVLPMQTGRHRIRPLFSERIKIVMHAGHPLARKDKLRGRDLHQQGIISLDESFLLQKQAKLLCDRYGAELKKDMETNSLDTLRLMVQMDMGIAVLPDLYIHTAMTGDGPLLARSLEDEPMSRTHVAAWRKQASSRQNYQKLSFEIKSIALEKFSGVLDEVVADENLPETW